MDLSPIRFQAEPFARPVFRASAQYTEGAEGSDTGFAASLNKAMTNLNDVQKNAKVMMEDFSAGANIPVHEVMMSMEKADLSMNLALQVRNKVLEAYGDIIRMQI